METILLNYKDVQFLLACTTSDAKHIVYKYMPEEDKEYLISSGSIKSNHLVDAERIDIIFNSPFADINGSKQVIYIINQMRTIGISDTMKHEVLEDVTNVIRGGYTANIHP
ncbi:hypothetical protein JGH11_10980 [Dysgonomonas sp. Marseille-P4677]|uniref:hypothetical protein n=1 Tax=Dysgonomonas sp. Marseille-P4677 TaxID=2364790 RepID=UPI001913C785|nr:hypothetical protein [Dysgonomonas sp. Marseille-P4677]MBK5721397.1 hypothetical protein [Dysgonomonas sp. Marseille-P4677]